MMKIDMYVTTVRATVLDVIYSKLSSTVQEVTILATPLIICAESTDRLTGMSQMGRASPDSSPCSCGNFSNISVNRSYFSQAFLGNQIFRAKFGDEDSNRDLLGCTTVCSRILR
jgi:hypothetical protein